jgi:hypothetical protein
MPLTLGRKYFTFGKLPETEGKLRRWSFSWGHPFSQPRESPDPIAHLRTASAGNLQSNQDMIGA